MFKKPGNMSRYEYFVYDDSSEVQILDTTPND